MTDRPLTLAEAAEHYSLTKGVLKVEGLRGRLAIYRAVYPGTLAGDGCGEWQGKP